MNRDKSPLKGVVVLRGYKVHFSALEGATQDRLPEATDWWIDKIETCFGASMEAKAKCVFELTHDDAIHQLVVDECRKTMEESNADYAIRNHWA